MTLEQNALWLMLGAAIVLGCAFGMLYCFLKVRRTYFPLKKRIFRLNVGYLPEYVLVFFEDVVFAFICAVATCLLTYHYAGGRLRGVVLFGETAGFVFYYTALGRLTVRLIGGLINLVGSAVRTVLALTVVPILRLAAFVTKATAGRLYCVLMTAVARAYMLRNGRNGFGILDEASKKGRVKNEEKIEYIHKSGGVRVHRVLHGDHRKDAV